MASPSRSQQTATVTMALKRASANLLFTSESDFPLTVWEMPLPASPASPATPLQITSENAMEVLIAAVPIATADRVVETSDLNWFFDRYTLSQDWWEPEQHADISRWQGLRSELEAELTDIQVFRIGQPSDWGLVGAIDVFVLGRASEGTLVGLHTVSVET